MISRTLGLAPAPAGH